MEILWFCAISLLLTLYVLLDGFDLGAGVVYLFTARSSRDRRAILDALGPFWDGNEIWLLAAAVALYVAFPAAYSAGFSGYYHVVAFALCLLLTRGIAGEAAKAGHRWAGAAFGVSSLAIPVLFGVTLGNLMQGVPLARTPDVFDWFPLLWGAAALAVTTLTGALWLASKTEGELQSRCRVLSSRVWWLTLVACAGAALSSPSAQPRFLETAENPWMILFAITALAGLLGVRLCQSVGFDLGAFGSTLALTAGLLGVLATAQFPYVLGPMSIFQAATGPHALTTSMLGWLPALVLAFGYTLGYSVIARRRRARTVADRPEEIFNREVVARAHSAAAR